MLWEEIRLAKDTDLLVLHAAIGPGAGHFARVIGLPQVLGQLAAGARVKRVVLEGKGPRSRQGQTVG